MDHAKQYQLPEDRVDHGWPDGIEHYADEGVVRVIKDVRVRVRTLASPPEIPNPYLVVEGVVYNRDPKLRKRLQQSFGEVQHLKFPLGALIECCVQATLRELLEGVRHGDVSETPGHD